MVMGTTLADVAPQLVTPPPPPPAPVPDGGADFPDAGTTPVPDAGTPPGDPTSGGGAASDGGIIVQGTGIVSPLLPSNGCTHTGSSLGFLALAAAALFLRRRR
jgi:MYXO-CTERM domain-containing protein